MEITYYKKSDDPTKSTVAEFGIKIPEWDMTLNHLKLILSKKGGMFAVAPAKKDGEVFTPYWGFSKDAERRFFDKALKLVEEYIHSKPEMSLHEEIF